MISDFQSRGFVILTKNDSIYADIWLFRGNIVMSHDWNFQQNIFSTANEQLNSCTCRKSVCLSLSFSLFGPYLGITVQWNSTQLVISVLMCIWLMNWDV